MRPSGPRATRAGAGVAGAGMYVPPASGFLVGVQVGAGASLSQSGAPDEVLLGLESPSLPLNEPAGDEKWSMKPSPAGLSGVSSFAAAGVLGGGGLTGAAVAGAGVFVPPAAGFLVGVHVGAGASLSQSGVPDEVLLALESPSLPLNEPAVVAKWSMKPSPAGLSGVSSLAAAGALGGGGRALGGGGMTGAAVAALNEPAGDAKWSMKPSPAGLSGVASAGASLALGAAAALAGVGAA